MIAFTKEWLRAAAAEERLALTDADVDAIYERLVQIKAALAAQRPEDTAELEPPYRFATPEKRDG